MINNTHHRGGRYSNAKFCPF